MKVHYISNIKKNSFGGGWSGMNYNISLQLSKVNELNYFYINPRITWTTMLFYKFIKSLGLKPFFPTFTRNRLAKIRNTHNNINNCNFDATFFFGSTSWIACNMLEPYFAYLDANFQTYLSIYHKDRGYETAQLKSIYDLEKKFLSNALCVFFSSKYALERTKIEYNLLGNNFEYVGLGSDMKNESKGKVVKLEQFLFVGIDFVGKGGHLLIDVFEELNLSFPVAKLIVVGSKPKTIKNYSNIEFVGYLDKSNPIDLNRLNEIYASSLALVLPTTKDLTPLVICEAASFKCATISIDDFGIQEMIRHNETGLLIKNDDNIRCSLITSMSSLLKDRIKAERLGENAYNFILENYNWDIVGSKINSKIISTLLK
jgi:glycosyltransferase involved in cell wall biosynthesis